MSDLHVRSDSVDVEQIMKQIRTRIREKRGSDYTEAELQQLASVKLEQFADPSGLRSDLLEQFRQRSNEPSTYHRHRGPRRWLLMLLHPLLKRIQKQLMADLNLYFEIIHNLVVEVTRLGIETQNLKMKVESLSSRLDFDERRVARARRRRAVPARSAAAPAPAGIAAADRSSNTSRISRRHTSRRRRPRASATVSYGAVGSGGHGGSAGPDPAATCRHVRNDCLARPARRQFLARQAHPVRLGRTAGDAVAAGVVVPGQTLAESPLANGGQAPGTQRSANASAPDDRTMADGPDEDDGAPDQ